MHRLHIVPLSLATTASRPTNSSPNSQPIPIKRWFIKQRFTWLISICHRRDQHCDVGCSQISQRTPGLLGRAWPPARPPTNKSTKLIPSLLSENRVTHFYNATQHVFTVARVKLRRHNDQSEIQTIGFVHGVVEKPFAGCV